MSYNNAVCQKRMPTRQKNFSVVEAIGGHIVTCSYYNNENDNGDTTYVIPKDQDFTNSLTNIVKLEMFK